MFEFESIQKELAEEKTKSESLESSKRLMKTKYDEDLQKL
jgi:hypothetical protein